MEHSNFLPPNYYNVLSYTNQQYKWWRQRLLWSFANFGYPQFCSSCASIPPPPHPHPFLFPESLIIRTFHFYRLSKVLQIHKVCFLTTALQSRFILLLPCCCLGVRAAETGLPTYSPCELGIRLKFWTGICWIVAWLWAFMFHQRLCEMLATRTYFPPPFSHPGKTHPHTIPKAK